MITATPFLAAAADAKLEDWGPLRSPPASHAHLRHDLVVCER